MDLHHLLVNRDKYLAHRPVAAITESLGSLSERWLKKTFPYRKKAIDRLVRRSYFSTAMAEALLDALFSELTRRKLTELLKAELGDVCVLDGFRRNPVTKNLHRAHGPGLVTHIFSANVPNPSIVSFVLGMLVKSVNVGKVSRNDPGILDIYLDSLSRHDRKLAKSNFLLNPHDKKGLESWIKKSDLVIAYGNNQTLSKIQKKIPPLTRFCGYGHRASFSLYTRELLKKSRIASLAVKTAKDIWMMDQRGCLSPMVIYVERGGGISPILFAKSVKKNLDTLTSRKQWTVFCDRSVRRFALSGGGKIIFIREFNQMKQVLRELLPIQQYLSAVALEAPPLRRLRLADVLAGLGVSRICHAGRLQQPPITWHHDGKPNLASWLTWTDLEYRA